MLVQKSSKKKTKVNESRSQVEATRSAVREIQAKKVAAKLIENPSMPVGAAMRAAGMSDYAANHPSTLTRTQEWSALLDEYLPQDEVLETHKGLLRASNIDHMVFADGPKTEDTALEWLARHNEKENAQQFMRDDVLSDDDIRIMLAEKNCEVRRITRTENSRHVYFWSADNRARKDALDMAYKLRGTYAAEKHLHVGFSLVDLGKQRELGQTPVAPQLGIGQIESE